MKTFKILFVFAALFSSGYTFAQKISKAELQVNGLTCSMCSRATESSLKSLSFIQSITPDLNRNVFEITFKSDKHVNVDQIRAKVEDAGFSVGSLSATIHFNKTVIDDTGMAQLENTAFKFTNAKSKTLDGPVTAKILDRNFVPAAAFKKNAAQFKSETYLRGKGTFKGKETRIVHLSI